MIWKYFYLKKIFYYFGFVKEHNFKRCLQEDNFIKRIKKFEMENPYDKIFLFIIKNNTFFDLELRDKADYPTFYRNEIKKRYYLVSKKKLVESKTK